MSCGSLNFELIEKYQKLFGRTLLGGNITPIRTLGILKILKFEKLWMIFKVL